MKLFSVLFPIALATSAFAHGFVSKVTIDGQAYAGDTPNGVDNPSIIRLIDTTSPVKGASNPDLNCGPGVTAATLIGEAMPGSAMAFTWTNGNWPHNTGPIMTYMASCGSTTCDKFDSTTAKWFKIDQQGLDSDRHWAQANVMAGADVNVTVPSTLAPGNYMVRHEIISLQLAVSEGGAEFYPSCSQLTVGGTQTGGPATSELVSFPGAYSDTDPGIFVPNVYDPSFTSYVFPGPAIAAFVGTSTGPATAAGAVSTGTANTASTATATPNAPVATSTSTCKIKKRATPLAGAAIVRPRHLSRIMRGLIAGHASS
ncbi:hypothetical protein C0991_004039 [Blastosporella zonata]|nr:hypothetical protein C0991_004039 [Blastosporella zonata]